MNTHPDVLWELVRQRQLEIGQEAAQRRRAQAGKHRRRRLRSASAQPSARPATVERSLGW